MELYLCSRCVCLCYEQGQLTVQLLRHGYWNFLDSVFDFVHFLYSIKFKMG